MIEKNSIHKNHWLFTEGGGGYLFFHWVLTGVSDRVQHSYMLTGSYFFKNLDALLPDIFWKLTPVFTS
jgi:hypothetical protein